MHRDPVADDRAGESTLGTEGQSIKGHKPTRLPDTRGQLLARFPARSFGGNQPQDDNLIIRYLCQHVEGAGTGIIILKQQSLSVNIVEDAFGDGIIPARDQPPAVLIASSKVETKDHPRKVTHHGVV